MGTLLKVLSFLRINLDESIEGQFLRLSSKEFYRDIDEGMHDFFQIILFCSKAL